MKFYLKQKPKILRQSYDVYNEADQRVYYIDQNRIGWMRELTLYDAATDEPLAEIKQKFKLFFNEVSISVYGEEVATIHQKPTFFRSNFDIPELGWRVEGNLTGLNYQVFDHQQQVVAQVSKKIFTWMDQYTIDMTGDRMEQVTVLAVVMMIDLVLDQKQSS